VGINATLYAKGEAIGMNRLNIDDYSGGTGYLGKDILGSVRGITNEYGVMEGRYEYDVFGVPYEGEMNGGMNLGYTGKPYDVITGMYNYGYRDYSPEVARFTTEDPVRDGANWFAYVNNDPVNWVDPWGLEQHYSEALVEFVKQAEGFAPELYLDDNGNLTVGYGHNTSPRANNDTERYRGVTLTEAQAEALLRSDLDIANRSLNNPQNVPNVDNLLQYQFDALVDRYFHEGSGAYYNRDPVEDIVFDRLSQNLPVVTDENRRNIIDAFLGNEMGGELNRRQNQAQLFLYGDYNGYASDPTRGNLCGQ
jgi:RHS repeat-associated protein